MILRVLLTALLSLLLVSGPASAAPIESLDTFHVKKGKVGMRADSLELRSSGGAGVAKFKYADSSADSPVFTIPASSSNASVLVTGGSLWQQAKRQVLRAHLSPNTGAAADSTIYRGTLYFGRAGSVKRIQVGCQTAPIGGTDTIKILKASSSGNTMLNAATFDATTMTNNSCTNATLTSTSADLALTATQGVYCEYSAGVQTTDAIDVSVTVEFEPDDY